MNIARRAGRLSLGVCACLLAACGGGGGGASVSPITLSTFQAADVVIGQATFAGFAANQGGAAGANTVSGTVGAPAEGSLYLADQVNNRVLGFNTVPTANDDAADFVLGQTDFTFTTGGIAADKLIGPLSTVTAGGKLFVTDYGNSRVLIWNTLPTVSGASADVAVGAVDLDTAGAGGATQTTLSNPIGLAVAAGHLFVTDPPNNRVLIWNTIPTASGALADLVLGQTDFTSSTGGVTASGLASPSDVWSDGTRVVVADTNNNRVLIWDTLPTANGQAADRVVGQPDFTTSTAGAGAQGLNRPFGVHSNGLQLFVADNGNHRVLVYDTFPAADQPSADVVIGQSDFAHVTRDDDDQDGSPDATPSARTLSSPIGVNVFGNRLFVASNANNRVLVYLGQ